MAYEFVCIHRLNKMMKDIDSVCRHIDPLIHHYLVDAAVERSDDIMLRSFAYNFDVFSRCTDPRHVSHHDVISDTVTVSVPTPSVLIIAQFGSLLTCIHSSQEHLLLHSRVL